MKKIFKYCFNTTVWIPSRSEWINLMSCLPNSERENITRYVYKNDSKQTLIGQILIRYCLKSLLNVDSNHLVIDRNSKGRPYLKLKETLNQAKVPANNIDHHIDFNISHSGDYTIICAGQFPLALTSSKNKSNNEDNLDDNTNFRVGTDIMKISIERSRATNPNDTNEELFRKELERHERVINSKFSNTEKNYIYNRPNIVESLTAFYRLWCLKESYVKALGDGVGFDLKRIECTPNSELLIDLNGKKHVVVNDTQLFLDSKLVKTCKYYEQYYMNNLTSNESTSSEHKHELHIMTLCILEKESSKSSKDKSSSSSTTNNNASAIQLSSEMDEFVEIGLKDLIGSVTPLHDLEECLNSDEFEDLWQRFCQKIEQP